MPRPRAWLLNHERQYAIGLDYGTNSVRALVVDTADGREVASAVWNYAHGDNGVILSRDPNLARQHPADYIKGAEITLRQALVRRRGKSRDSSRIKSSASAWTPRAARPPLDADGRALAFTPIWGQPNAMAWLWKDHTGIAEAAEITELARKIRPQYLAKCGGTYSSEWFFSKILHCLRVSPGIFQAAHSWTEWPTTIPALLTGAERRPDAIAGICAAGHKAMFNPSWGGYPDAEFLGKLDPRLGELRSRLCHKVRGS